MAKNEVLANRGEIALTPAQRRRVEDLLERSEAGRGIPQRSRSAHGGPEPGEEIDSGTIQGILQRATLAHSLRPRNRRQAAGFDSGLLRRAGSEQHSGRTRPDKERPRLSAESTSSKSSASAPLPSRLPLPEITRSQGSRSAPPG